MSTKRVLNFLMYSQPTGQITKLKGENEYKHSRAKMQFYAEIFFFHIFELICLVYLRENI